jgi:osmoprotectant transport system substrate-binding protein
MRSPRAQWITLLAAVVVTVSAITGCGLVSSSGTFHSSRLPGGARPLAGAKLTITSKSFTEGVLLGKITATYLAAAGADVTDLTGAPGSASSRQAQLNGDADILWEYTGTGWVDYHNETETIADPQVLWQRVHDAEKHGHNLIWLPPANFNDTYGPGSRRRRLRLAEERKTGRVAPRPRICPNLWGGRLSPRWAVINPAARLESVNSSRFDARRRS